LREFPVLSRPWFGITPLLGMLSSSCADPSAPASHLTGIWVSRSLPLMDSLLLVILDSAGQLQGYGRPYPAHPTGTAVAREPGPTWI
jgi:hypothetical protein